MMVPSARAPIARSNAARTLALCCLVAVVTVAGAAGDARAQRIEWADPPRAWPHPVRDSVRFGWLQVPVDHAGLVGWLWQNPWRAGVPAAAMLLFVIPVIGIPVREMRAAPRSARDRLEALVLFALSIIGLTLLIGAALAVFTGMRTHVVVPLVGVTRPWAWLLALPWLLLALAAAALVLIPIRARDAGAARYIYWSSMAGAAVVLALWALHSVG